MRIFTLNMQFWMCKMKKVDQFLRNSRPDIVCFQEGFHFLWMNFIKRLARNNHYEVRTHPMNCRFGASWDLGIMSDPPIMDTKYKDLGKIDDWTRGFLGCCLEGGIKVTSVHLACTANRPEKHIWQVDELLKFNDYLPIKNPSLELICGDFNCTPDHEAIKKMLQSGFKFASMAPTYKDTKIDYVLWRGDVNPVLGVHLNGVSDHRGLMVELV